MHPMKRLDGSFINDPTNVFLQDSIEQIIIILEQQMVVWETCRHLGLDWSGLNWMWLIQQQGSCHRWHRHILPNDVWKVWFPSPKNLGCVYIDWIIPFCHSHRKQQIWNIGCSLLRFILERLALYIEVIHHILTDVTHSELACNWFVIVHNAQTIFRRLGDLPGTQKGTLSIKAPTEALASVFWILSGFLQLEHHWSQSSSYQSDRSSKVGIPSARR